MITILNGYKPIAPLAIPQEDLRHGDTAVFGLPNPSFPTMTKMVTGKIWKQHHCMFLGCPKQPTYLLRRYSATQESVLTLCDHHAGRAQSLPRGKSNVDVYPLGQNQGFYFPYDDFLVG
jgi:hypothetical protein